MKHDEDISRGEFRLPEPIDFFGLPVRPLDMRGLIESAVALARRKQPTTFAYLNAHTFNLSRDDAAFARALAACDVLFADGVSIVWASRRLGRPLPRRLTAADYFPRFARRCADEGLSLFLLGGRPGVAGKAAAALMRDYPGLRIAGTRDGYFSGQDSGEIVAEINAAKPDVLVVGLGSPRQESWLIEHRDALKAPVRWCVGAMFDYLAGVERRAPAWLCGLGCEWLFRFMMDPRGKWRRYLLGNPRFVWHVLRETSRGAGRTE